MPACEAGNRSFDRSPDGCRPNTGVHWPTVNIGPPESRRPPTAACGDKSLKRSMAWPYRLSQAFDSGRVTSAGGIPTALGVLGEALRQEHARHHEGTERDTHDAHLGDENEMIEAEEERAHSQSAHQNPSNENVFQSHPSSLPQVAQRTPNQPFPTGCSWPAAALAERS